MVALHPQQPDPTHQSQDFNQALSRLRYLVRPGSQVILISDFHRLNEEGKRHLSLLARHNDLIACEIFDPLELTLPKGGFASDLPITDGKQRALLPLSQSRRREQYQTRLEQARKQRLQQLQQAGCRLFHIGADEPIADQWLRQHHGK
jgi:hypothetical protein